jgi:hypothetical protein
MKLLLNERNLIIGISKDIEYGVWGNVRDLSSWKIGANEYAMDNNYSLVDIGDTPIPTYVTAGAYYYIDGEFRLADECPNEYRDRIVELEDLLIASDEAVVSLYEMQTAQDEINMAQDEAIIGLYELMGGGV